MVDFKILIELKPVSKTAHIPVTANMLPSDIDMLVGHWVDGAPYKFSNAEDWKTSGRFYYLKSKNITTLCDPPASNYLQVVGGRSPSIFKVNGRNMYIIDGKRYENKMPLQIVRPLYPKADYRHLNGDYLMYNMICSPRRVNVPYDVLRTAGRKDSCTPVGAKMASSLIRAASTRIFAEPEQSILELPVNSIDSYGSGSKIGKFGMGFFSFLYWLVGHPKRRLYINSFCIEGGDRIAYTVTIQEISGVLTFNLKVHDATAPRTGTMIMLDSNTDRWELENMNKMDSYIANLKFVRSVPIVGNYGEIINERALDKPVKTVSFEDPFVKIYVSWRHVIVEDYATGIPLSTLLNSLFIPSVSTKTIAMSKKSGDWVSRSGYFTDAAYCYITVGDIVVKKIAMSTDVSLRLDLPPYMRLPVSRDDVIIEGAEEDVEKALDGLRQIMYTHGKHFLYFQEFLDKWAESTHSMYNRSFIGAYLQKMDEELKDRYTTMYEQLTAIDVKGMLSSTKQYATFISAKLAEKYKGNIRENLYNMKRVVVVPQITHRNFGTNDFLFVSEQETRESDWIAQFAMKYTESALIPLGGDIKEIEYPENMKEWALTHSIGVAVDKIPERERRYVRMNQILYQTFLDMNHWVNLENDWIYAIYAYLQHAHNVDTKMNTNSQLYDKAYNIVLKYLGSKKGRGREYGEGKETISFTRNIDNMNIGYARAEIIRELYKSEKDRKTILYFENLFLDFFSELTETKDDWNLSYGLLTKFNMYRRLENMTTLQYLYHLLDHNEISKLHSLVEMEITAKEYMVVSKVMGTDTATTVDLPKVLTEYRSDRSMYRHINSGHISWGYPRISAFVTYAQSLKERVLAINRVVPSGKLIINPPTKESEVYTYTLKRFIEYLYDKDERNIMSISKQMSDYKGRDIPMQILEIAINEGTTKDYFEATLTELVQNSIDAIRGSRVANPSVNIFATQKQNEAIVSVSDFIGMSGANLTALSVPFLSTKSAGDVASTGEMGSGFFNIYRKADKVTIATSQMDGEGIYIEDVPIRDGDRVIDIDRKIYSAKLKKGTVINMHIKTDTENKANKIVSHVFSFVSNVIALSLGVEVFFNDERVGQKLHKVADTKHFEVYTVNNKYQPSAFDKPNTLVYKNYHKTFPSYILTNGVPFTYLSDYVDFKRYKNWQGNGYSNILVNVKPGAYTPTQSRTSISLVPGAQKELEDAVMNAVYLNALDQDLQESKHRYVEHLRSEADYTQLAFSHQSSSSTFIIDFVFPGLKSLRNYINEAKLNPKIWTDPKKKPNVPNVIYWVVNSWISLKLDAEKRRREKMVEEQGGKVVLMKKSKGKIMSEEDAFVEARKRRDEEGLAHDETIKPDRELVREFLQTFANVFWEMGKKLKINGFDSSTPNVSFRYLPVKDDPSGNYAGVYWKYNHTIAINTYYANIPWVLVKLMIKDGVVTTMTNYRMQPQKEIYEFIRKYLDLLGSTSCTFIHELEHARRRTDESTSSHGGMVLDVPGTAKDLYTFDGCANAVYKAIVEAGFYKELDLEIKAHQLAKTLMGKV